MDGTSSGDTKPQGYVTKLSEEDILKQATENKRTPGWLQPEDVNPRNVRECVSLVRAVIPEATLPGGIGAVPRLFASCAINSPVYPLAP